MSSAAPRRVLLTGAESGIGLEAALQLAARGDHVVVADRNTAGGEAAPRDRGATTA
ncbi:MAG TPA: SDR family NAD(P)-dependent oxidoreductase [Candidatus Limnocylindria bacterium]|nr:SDR family NAD(P)-dependent oxidoreductase [Candidatus Limnocylindria bacterium]